MDTVKWTIYCHTHIASGRRYIGLTKKTMMARWNQHLNNADQKRGKGCRHFWNAIRAYGKDAFSHEVLETCATVEEANAAEERWIEFYDARNLEKGFNLLRGGAHQPHPEKRNPWDRDGFRDRVSASMTEWFKDPVNAATHSARSKATNSRPDVRKKQSESTSRQFADPSVRARMSEVIAARHADPEISASFRKGLETANRNRREKTHCKNSHAFTPENTRRDDKGWRYCKRCQCDRISKRDREARTHCKNGHEFVSGSFKLSKSGQRVCSLCLPTHCKNGHEFSPENTRVTPKARICVTCKRATEVRSRMSPS